MTLKLALIGASGRSGSEVLRVLPEYSQFKLVAAVSSGKNKSSKHTSVNSPVPLTSDLEQAIAMADCVLEFSSAAASVEIAQLCAKHGRPLVIASSGQTQGQLEGISAAATMIPILHAANLSLGVLVLHEVCKQAQKMLGANYQIEIMELHHQHKKDAPSGTALSLARALTADRDLAVINDRAARPGPRALNEVGISSLRAGEVLGEHTVFFVGPGERLELTHRTSDRAVFARGGLIAIERLMGRPARLYKLRELFEVP